MILTKWLNRGNGGCTVIFQRTSEIQPVSELNLTHVSGKRGLQTGLPLFPLNGLDQSRLLSADVSTGAAHHKHVEVVARAAGILSDQPRRVRLVNGDLRSKTKKFYISITMNSLQIQQG